MSAVLFLCAYSCAVMFFCAGSSPFVKLTSTDSSVFLTIGRAMAAGKVPYLDLFDHKGLYLYFINYLGAVLSPGSKTGVFMIECCFMAVNAVLYYALSRYFIAEKFKRVIFSLIMIFVTLNPWTYQAGNITETYALTFQLTAFYLIIRYYQSGRIKHSPALVFMHGLCVGVVLFLRPNLIAMWGAVLVVIGLRLLYHKEYRNFAANIFAGLAGLILAVTPPLIYMTATGSLDAMINDYILFNMRYTGSGVANIFSNVASAYAHSGGKIKLLLLTSLLSAGIICKGGYNFKAIFVTAFIFSVIGAGVSGRSYGHYFEILVLFSIPLVILMLNRFTIYDNEKFCAVAIILVAALGYNARSAVKLSRDTTVKSLVDFMEQTAAYYETIRREDDTVLATGIYTMFYNRLNVVPKMKYFYVPAIPYERYPYAVDAMSESLQKRENNIVIVNYYQTDEGHKTIFHPIAYYKYDNEKDILSLLAANYDLVLESQDGDHQMYVKKGRLAN